MLRSENKQEYPKTTETVPDELIDNLFYMPYTTVCILYVLFVAYKTNTAFNDVIIDSIDKGDNIRGCFFGVVSVLISFKIIETKTDYISDLKIDNMSTYLCSKIKDELLSYYLPEEMEKRKKNKSETPEEFIERINKLFGYQENN